MRTEGVPHRWGVRFFEAVQRHGKAVIEDAYEMDLRGVRRETRLSVTGAA